MMRMRFGAVMIHLSLVLIAIGAVATWLGREAHTITLSRGKPVMVAELGCELLMDSFVIETHPGGIAPRDFRTYLTIGNRKLSVAVNSPAEIEGYTLRQDRCDASGRSTLELSKDPLGIPLTFAGYALFTIGGICCLIDRRGAFRRLVSALSLMLGAISADAAPAIPAEQAASMEMKQVSWNGRVTSMHTASTELLHSITGKRTPARAVRTVASMVLFADQWSREPILPVSNPRLTGLLGIAAGECIAPAELFDSKGQYRLRAWYGLDQSLDEAIIDLDTRRELFSDLIEGRLIRPVQPTDHVSQTALWADRFNTDIPFTLIFFPAALLLGGRTAAGIRPRATSTAAWALAAWQAAGWIIRWIALGSIPLSGGGATMQFLSVIILTGILLLPHLDRLLRGSGIIMAGLAGLVAWLSLRNPAISPIMPVLRSHWLSVHVTLVMSSYAIFAIAFAGAVLSLLRPERSRLLAVRALLYPGVILLGLGIITGAVWAQQSWGRYWAWDPKETAALVTLLIYSLPLHRLKLFSRQRTLAAYLAVAFAAVIVTYFGLTALPSLHSYR